MDSTDAALVCSTGVRFSISVLKHWKKKATLGTSIMNQKYTDKKILVSVRTPEGITIKYFNCIRRVARKATISFVMSACRPFRAKQLVSQWIDFCCVSYWEILLQFFWENASWVNIGQNIRPFTCDLVLLLEETMSGRNIANIFAQDCTFTSRGLLLYRVRIERLARARAHVQVFLVFHL